MIERLLEAVQPASVIEVGADRGDFTELLLDWARGSGARVVAVDPDPPPELLELAERHPELTLVRRPSTEALAELDPPDAVILDGDHNYHTVSEELKLIRATAGAAIARHGI